MAGAVADGWNGWGLDPAEFGRKARLLWEEAGAAGREAQATWAGIALVGRDEREAMTLLETRRTRGMPDTGIWVGTEERFGAFLRELKDAGASWAILVPAGPQDRVEVIAGAVLASSDRP
jgi:alkanesulfonate monooxygenase SsuD/methylene tetrahydromethanopterin reductase-like flavin-dependent oxidoreductase (luciferase family)